MHTFKSSFWVTRLSRSTARIVGRPPAFAHNALLDLDELEQSEQDQIRANYTRLAAVCRGFAVEQSP